MSDFNCPYCKHEHNFGDHDLWKYETETPIEFECAGCDKEFSLSYYYEPVVTARCADGEHDMAEYWEGIDSWPTEQEIRAKHPTLANSLWCKNCDHYEDKESPEQES